MAGGGDSDGGDGSEDGGGDSGGRMMAMDNADVARKKQPQPKKKKTKPFKRRIPSDRNSATYQGRGIVHEHEQRYNPVVVPIDQMDVIPFSTPLENSMLLDI